MEEKLKNIDRSNIKRVILDFPKQFRIGLRAAEKIKTKKNPRYLFILGMGGSVLPGEILKIYFEKKKVKVPLFLIRDYKDVFLAEKKDLAVAISYSGNTEETISLFFEAKKKNVEIVSITSGGKLAQISHKNKLIVVPSGVPPRFALGYLFSALFYVLTRAKAVANVEEILSLEQKLDAAALEKRGKNLAKVLKNKIPLIYSSRINFPLATIWKIKFNENSKIPAFCNFFPELNHNEMVGFTKVSNFKIKKSDFSVIVIKDNEDDPRNKKRMELTEKILKKEGVFFQNVWLEGGNIFEKIFNNLLLADWVTYYLALNYKVDPAPVKMVEEFKKSMEK